MKQIKINNLTVPRKDGILATDKKYCVWLGNETRNYFTSQKACDNFLANTNRFLNENLQNLNNIYIQLFSEFRQVWFYGDSAHNSIIKIEQEFKNVEYAFENVINKSAHPINGNSYAFTILFRICDSQRLIAENIIQIYLQKKIYVPTHRLKYLKAQIKMIENGLRSLGKETVFEVADDFIELDQVY